MKKWLKNNIKNGKDVVYEYFSYILILEVLFSLYIFIFGILRIEFDLKIDLATIGAFGAFFAAFAALYTGLQTKRHVMSQTIIQLREIYAKDEMLTGMNNIMEWKEKCESHNQDFAEQFASLRHSHKPAIEVDKARRKYSHFMQTIAELYQAKAINDDFVKRTIRKSSVDFLIEYIEPLEKKLPYGDDPRSDYNTIYKIFGYDHLY